MCSQTRNKATNEGERLKPHAPAAQLDPFAFKLNSESKFAALSNRREHRLKASCYLSDRSLASSVDIFIRSTRDTPENDRMKSIIPLPMLKYYQHPELANRYKE